MGRWSGGNRCFLWELDYSIGAKRTICRGSDLLMTCFFGVPSCRASR